MESIDLASIDPVENRRRMERGELYYAFTPELTGDRARCRVASAKFNSAAADTSRRTMVELWRGIVNDTSPLPPRAATPEEDDSLFEHEPWVEAPVKLDYGYNVKLGQGVFVNSGSVWIDTCPIEIGARTIMGPHVSFFSATHPINPFLRNGTNGPESGKPIKVGEDCWLGGNVTILQGITIGRGVTVGAGSVVTKDLPDFVVAVGNPARILRKIDMSESPEAVKPAEGAEVLVGEDTKATS